MTVSSLLVHLQSFEVCLGSLSHSNINHSPHRCKPDSDACLKNRLLLLLAQGGVSYAICILSSLGLSSWVEVPLAWETQGQDMQTLG